METTTESAKPTFLYDDGCPLCRTYTATFTALGWADRAAFSKIDDTTFAALDMETARHHIPLHKPGEETQYGLDAIMAVVGTEVPLLGAIGNHRMVRPALDRMYWFITYNRRHIVSAAPPTDGVDCAPDYNPSAIGCYLGFCALATAAFGAAGVPAAATGATAAGVVMTARRHPSWEIRPMQAAGHAASIATAASAVGAIVKLAGAGPKISAAATAATALRKIALRRWMLRARPTPAQTSR